jgi:hypothetical protein
LKEELKQHYKLQKLDRFSGYIYKLCEHRRKVYPNRELKLFCMRKNNVGSLTKDLNWVRKGY